MARVASTMSASVGSEKSTTDRSWLSVPTAVHASARAAFRGLSLVAPGPAAWLARELFLTPQRHQPPVRETWWRTEAERFGLPFEGRELAAWRWGWGGPTILLVHGWSGRGLQLGAFAEPLVEAGYQVVAFDGPGHGESPGRQTNLPEFARAIAAATRALGGVDAIIAHSFGAGSTLVSLAYEAPQVQRLVFVAPPGRLRTITATFEQATGFSADVLDRMRQSIERRFGLSWSDLDPQELASRVDPRHRTLVVHDREDREIPWNDALDLATHLPSAELRTTEGLGHRRILRDPAVVTTVVDFLGPVDRD